MKARKRSAAQKTGVRSATRAVRSVRKASPKIDSIGASDGSFPKKTTEAGFDREAGRCIALIDDGRKPGTTAYARAIATILDNAATITERPACTLDDTELSTFGKRLKKLHFGAYLERLRALLMRREWGDAYCVALRAMSDAGAEQPEAPEERIARCTSKSGFNAAIATIAPYLKRRRVAQKAGLAV
jgi:hypothetical protein